MDVLGNAWVLVAVVAGVIVLMVGGTVARVAMTHRTIGRLSDLGQSSGTSAPPAAPPAGYPLSGVGVQVVGDASTMTEVQRAKLRALGIELPPPDQTEVVASRSVLDDIERLAALRDSGVLTSDEFEDQKRRVLGTDT
ncbi:SHOCT domain-containing protein [Cnuibacter sp. UC19_7]|uniref:SHOCT domain-containing protein n=1 Tax=Cnuibacter sp. UC19_7 TaxID=3350166 RepID=UPI0036704509